MATSKNRDARVLVGFKYDASDEQKYLNTLERAKLAQLRLEKQQKATNDAVYQGVRVYDDASSGTYQAASVTDKWARSEELARQNAEAFNDTLLDRYRLVRDAAEEEEAYQRILGKTPSASRVTGSRGGGSSNSPDFTERVDRFGSRGTQLLSGLGGGDAANAVGFIGDLADTIGTLGVVGSVGAGAMAGLAIGMSIVNEQTKGLTQTFRGAVGAQEIYYNSLTQTSEGVREQIAALQRDSEIRQQRINEILGAFGGDIDVTERRLLELGRTLNNDLSSEALDLIGTYETLTQEQETNRQAIERLTTGLQIGAFASNDAAEAEALLAEERERTAEAARQFWGQVELKQGDAFIDALQMTDAAIQDSIQTRRDEITNINSLLATLTLSADGQKHYRDRIIELNEEIRALNLAMGLNIDTVHSMNSAVKQLTGGIAGMQDVALYSAKDYADAIADTRAAQDAVAKAQTDLANTETKNAAEIEAARREALENEQKLQEKFNLDTKRAAEDLADDLKKIRDDERFDVLNAVGERDAKAAYLARMNADKEANDAEDAARKERGRQKEDYEKELRAAKLTGQKRIDLEIAQGRAEVDAKRAALITTQNDLAKAQGTQQLIYRTGYGVMLSEAEIFSQRMQQAIKKAFILPTGSSKSGTGKNTTVVNAINGIVDARMNSTLRAAGS